MKKENHNLVSELKQLLKNYLVKPDVQDFIKNLETYDESEINHFNSNDLDKTQMEFEVASGKDNRFWVDRVITLSEMMLSKEKHLALLLDLSQIMLSMGELDFAFEITQNITSKIENNPDHSDLAAETELLIAKIYWSQAQWDESEFHIEEAYNIYTASSNKCGYAKCENMYGTLHGEKGDFVKAKEHFEKALALLKNDECISLQAMIFTNLGIIYTIFGDFEKAIWNHKNSIDKFEKLSNTNHIARVYHNIGMLYTRMMKYDEALEEFNKCITLSLESNYLSNCAIAYIGKAYIYSKLNNQQLADAFTDKAMEIAYKINDTLSIADIYKIKGMINSDLENFELSEEFFDNSIRLNNDFENSFSKAESSVEMSKLLNKMDRKEEAISYIQSAQNYFSQLGLDKKSAGLVEMAI